MKLLNSILKIIYKILLGFKQYNLIKNIIFAFCCSFIYSIFFILFEKISFNFLNIFTLTFLFFILFFVWFFLFVYFIIQNIEFFSKFFKYKEPISQIEIKSIYFFILYYLYFIIKAFPLFILSIIIPSTLIGKILLNLVLFCLYIIIKFFE
jgi:hypothetical protein